MELLSGIYTITCAATGSVYVGSAVNVEQRWAVHRYVLDKGRGSARLQKAWDMYGGPTFIFEVIEYVEHPTLLIEREQFHIDRLGACRNGLNIAPRAGSRLGVPQSEEARRRMSSSKKGRTRPPLPEHEKARLATLFKGKRHSEETRKKLSLQRLGKKRKPHSAEAKAKIGLAHRGMKHSQDTRARMSVSHRGKRTGPMTQEQKDLLSRLRRGKKLSAETRWKMSEARKGRVHSAITRERLSASNKRAKILEKALHGNTKTAITRMGHKDGMAGKKHSAETRAKMSAAAKIRRGRVRLCVIRASTSLLCSKYHG